MAASQARARFLLPGAFAAVIVAAPTTRHPYTADTRVARSLSSFIRISLIAAAASAGPLAQTLVAQSAPAIDSSAGPRSKVASDSSQAAVAAPHVDKTFFTRHDLATAGIAFVASAAVSVFDKRIGSWTRTPRVQGDSSRHDFVKSLTVINEQPLTIGAFAIYGVGRLAGWNTVADLGLHTTEALVLTVGVSEAIRGPLGRARPRISPNDQYNFSFWAGFTDFGKRSYPSIHAAVAFATATALTSEIHERNPGANVWAAPLLYAGALVPGFTRMYLYQHWASDVVAGAFTGT
ncbi:MAG: phosphatase PAP2 family protein, partial [Gemmatimonadaceae bacterium]